MVGLFGYLRDECHAMLRRLLSAGDSHVLLRAYISAYLFVVQGVILDYSAAKIATFALNISKNGV